MADTTLMPCTATCAGGTYRAALCTLVSDTSCVACTSTPAGHVTTTQCNATTNTVWAACPAGKACYGGVVWDACPYPRYPSGGLCVCPNATVATSDAAPCLPITCPSGQYPDPDTDACRACTQPGFPEVQTVAGVVGLGACACAAGFFQRAIDAHTVRCWPCGELQCDAETQSQMQCYGGGSTREPTCECLLPAGAVATPGSHYCTFQCAAGYVSDPQASFDPIARVGTVLSIVNDTQGPQVLNFTAAMKQALPVGRQHIFFVSRANELWLSTFNTTAGAWGPPEVFNSYSKSLPLVPLLRHHCDASDARNSPPSVAP